MVVSYTQTRLVPGAVEKLVEMLTWAGLKPDEGNILSIYFSRNYNFELASNSIHRYDIFVEYDTFIFALKINVFNVTSF